jgi:hypothetical protein
MPVNIKVLHTFFFALPFNEFLINLLFRDIFLNIFNANYLVDSVILLCL